MSPTPPSWPHLKGLLVSAAERPWASEPTGPMESPPAGWKVSSLILVRVQGNLFPTLRKFEEDKMWKEKQWFLS